MLRADQKLPRGGAAHPHTAFVGGGRLGPRWALPLCDLSPGQGHHRSAEWQPGSGGRRGPPHSASGAPPRGSVPGTLSVSPGSSPPQTPARHLRLRSQGLSLSAPTAARHPSATPVSRPHPCRWRSCSQPRTVTGSNSGDTSGERMCTWTRSDDRNSVLSGTPTPPASAPHPNSSWFHSTEPRTPTRASVTHAKAHRVAGTPRKLPTRFPQLPPATKLSGQDLLAPAPPPSRVRGLPVSPACPPQHLSHSVSHKHSANAS